MSYQSESYRKTAETLIQNLKKRGMEGIYCSDRQEAARTVRQLIPRGSVVSWGGSVTLEESGILDTVRSMDLQLLDRKDAVTPEEIRKMNGSIFSSDYFLTSTNALTLDGRLVNIDGRGNRVACLIYGPEHVLVIAGMNKLCADTRDAVHRIRTAACPPNALRVGAKTPCAVTGVCADCLSEDCICCQIVITRRSRIPGRITVILVGEELGF